MARLVVTSAPDVVMGPGAEVQIQSDAIPGSSHQSCRHLLHSDTFRATFNISRHPVDCQQLQLSVFPGHGHHHLIQPDTVNTIRLFIGGEDESWEYLVSVECSKRQFLNI